MEASLAKEIAGFIKQISIKKLLQIKDVAYGKDLKKWK